MPTGITDNFCADTFDNGSTAFGVLAVTPRGIDAG